MPGFDIGSIGTQAAGNAMDSIFGMILGGYNDQRQKRQQQDLTNIQIAAQKRMMDYSQQKQYEMWLKTNYGAQMEQLTKAGLNPGLIYGMGGSGGATTGNAQGNVTGAQAQQNPGEIQQMMGIGLQSQLQAAQIKLMESQAKNLDADTTKKAGVDTTKAQTEISKLIAETTNEITKNKLLQIETTIQGLEADIKGQTKEATIDILKTKQLQVIEDLEKMTRQNLIGKSTQWAVIDAIRAQAVGAALKNILTGAEIRKTHAETSLIGKSIQLTQQEWEQNIQKLIMAWRQDGREGMKTLIMQNPDNYNLEKDPGEQIVNNIVDIIQSILLIKTITKPEAATGRRMDR